MKLSKIWWSHVKSVEALLKRGRTSPNWVQVHPSSCLSTPIQACKENCTWTGTQVYSSWNWARCSEPSLPARGELVCKVHRVQFQPQCQREGSKVPQWQACKAWGTWTSEVISGNVKSSMVKSSHIWSCQVKNEQFKEIWWSKVKYGLVKIGKIKSNMVNLSPIWSSQVKSGQFKSNYVRSSQIWLIQIKIWSSRVTFGQVK